MSQSIPKLCVRLAQGTTQETEDAIWCIAEFAGYLVSGHSSGNILFWNSANNHQSKKRRRDHLMSHLHLAKKIDRAHTDVVRTLSICNLSTLHNTAFLVSGSWDKSIKIWNSDGLVVTQIAQAHQDWIYCTCYIKDNIFASGSANGSVRLWQLISSEKEVSVSASQTLNCGGEAMCMTLYEWNNTKIFGIGTRNIIALYNEANFEQLGTLEGHTGPVLCLTQWKYFLVSGSEDRCVHVWSIDGDLLQVLKCSTDWVTSIHVWKDILCAGYRDWNVRCWTWNGYGRSLDEFVIKNGEHIKRKTAYPIFLTSCDAELTGQTLSIKALCVWKNQLCSASLDGSLRVWKGVQV